MESEISEIRLFISSTFRDLDAERTHLVRKVFPELQILAEERGLNFIPIDLRWGITEAEAQSGKVLEICLNEIESSRPFFVGVLGDRYGWCPEKSELDSNPKLLEQWGEWLPSDLSNGLSITEIEMQYGALRNQENIYASFFARKGCVDAGVDSLRKKIESDGRYELKEFSTPEELGVLVRDSFIKLLNVIAPAHDVDEIDRACRAKKAFITPLTFYFYYPPLFTKVFESFVGVDKDSGYTMFLTAPNGMGKSALMANLYYDYYDDCQRELACWFVEDAYIGGDYRRLVKMLAAEICAVYDFDFEEFDNTNPDILLAVLFNRIPDDRPLTVMIDGLNHLENEGPAKGLAWLPISPKNVTYILTSTPEDRVVDAVKAREINKSVLYIPTSLIFKKDIRKEIITNYLDIFGKRLDASGETDAKIAAWPLSRNNAILRTLLDSLIKFGNYEQLHSFLESFLTLQTEDEFFAHLLEYYEQDFGYADVSSALGLIAYSRSGLSEQQIMEIGGLRQIQWSQLRHAFKSFFRINEKQLKFSSDLFRRAVTVRYNSREKDLRSAIIKHFENVDNQASYLELAHQYLALGKRNDLHKLLLRKEVFDVLYLDRPYKLASIWKSLGKQKIEGRRPSLLDYLSTPIENPVERINFLLHVSKFAFENCALYTEAEEIVKSAIHIYDSSEINESLLLANLYDTMAETSVADGTQYKDIEQNAGISFIKGALELKLDNNATLPADLARSYELTGMVFVSEYEKELADYCFRKAYELYAQANGKNSIECADCLSVWGRYLENEDLIRKAINAKMSLVGDNHPWLAEDYKALAKAADDEQLSRDASEKALRISRTEFGNDDKRTKNIKKYNFINKLFHKIFSIRYFEDSEDDISLFKTSLGCLHGILLCLGVILGFLALPTIFIYKWVTSGFMAAYNFGAIIFIICLICMWIGDYLKVRSFAKTGQSLLQIAVIAFAIYFVPVFFTRTGNIWLNLLICFLVCLIIGFYMYMREKKIEARGLKGGIKAYDELVAMIKAEMASMKEK